MTWLVTADLHLTDRAEHAYRFEFLRWLAGQAEAPDVTAVLILGDITDQKDRHAAPFVNAVVNAMERLAFFAPLHILYGNHDGPSPDRPYWNFLRYVGNIAYYIGLDPVDLLVSGNGKAVRRAKVLMSPWGTENDAIIALNNDPTFEYLFMHVTVAGCRVENGTTMAEGCPARFKPEGCKTKVYSGDIHVPQIVGDVEYVGAPYHVHYGDPFAGRILAIDPVSKRVTERVFPGAPRLHHLKLSTTTTHLPTYIKPGDRVKVTALSETALLPADWQAYVKTIRTNIEAAGVELTATTFGGVTGAGAAAKAPSARRSDEAVVRTFSAAQKYSPATLDVGVDIVKADK